MAAQKTAIANIYEPAIWSKYLLEETTAQSKLIQSGIAGTNPEIDAAAAQGGRTVYMPFWDDLSHDTGTADRSKVATDDDTDITPDGLTTDEDVAVKFFRTQAWNASPMVNYAAGSDPVAVILNRYVNWWLREENRILLKTLYGVFSDTTIATALSNDISVQTTTTNPDNLFSTDAFLDTQFLLGDAYAKLTALAVHSVVYKRMCKLDLIDNLPESQQNPTVMPTYMGKTVIVDDTMTKVAGTTSGYRYYSYLFGAGAIARTNVPLLTNDPAVELYRQPMAGTGMGSNTIITRRAFLMHPRGIKYGGSLTVAGGPSDSDIAADNWTQVYQTKNIRIARLITNG